MRGKRAVLRATDFACDEMRAGTRVGAVPSCGVLRAVPQALGQDFDVEALLVIALAARALVTQ